MKLKSWFSGCSRACVEATESRCRCKCNGRYHGGKGLIVLDEYFEEKDQG